MKVSWANVVLIGLVILMAVLLVESNRADHTAVADGATGAAGGVVAVTGRLDQYGDVLYMIDTNNQTILVYGYYPPTGGARAFDRGVFRLLAGRSYKWDTRASQKVTIFSSGRETKPTVADVKRQFEKASRQR